MPTTSPGGSGRPSGDSAAARRSSRASCRGAEVPVDPVSGRRWFPSFAFPEQAAIAAARAVEYGRWRDRAPGTVPRFADVRSDEADAILASALSRGSGWLEPEEVDGLLACYGIPVAASKLARHPGGGGSTRGRARRAGGAQGRRPVAQDRRRRCSAGAERRGGRGRGRNRDAGASPSDRGAAEGLLRPGDGRRRGDARRRHARRRLRADRRVRRGWHDRGAAEGRRCARRSRHGRRRP